MNATSPSSSAMKPLLVVAGILFMVLWIAAHCAWAAMALMANLMANDSGAASTDQQMALIVGMLAGQVLAGAAGIPAGLAFFRRGRRKPLLVLFAVLLVAGALCQLWAFQSFFAAAAAHS